MAETVTATPRKVILFSGHMIDAQDRSSPRFPADREDIAKSAIDKALDMIGVGAADLCICGGACGGDLLFAEAAAARGAQLELYIPADEETFLESSVTFAGERWRERFKAAKARGAVHVLSHELQDLAGANPFEQNNLRMLASAERDGAEKLDFICLWNGEANGGPGGTKHLMDEVRRIGGRVHWLDTRKLWEC